MLTNILENSVKYRDETKDKSIIEVSFQKTQDQVLVSVSDNGQGIQEECVPKILEMFFRANAEILGTGLGLYIVSDLVGKLNGKVTVTSVYGKHTTFIIVLPNLEKH